MFVRESSPRLKAKSTFLKATFKQARRFFRSAGERPGRPGGVDASVNDGTRAASKEHI
jgi:hypothetical protein